MNCQLQIVMLTATYVRQAKANVYLSREFCTLHQLKSYVTKFPLQCEPSRLPHFFGC